MKTFPLIKSRLMPHSFWHSRLFPFLKIGIMMAFSHVLGIVSVRHIFLRKKVHLLEKNITASLDRFRCNCIHTKRFSIFQSPDGCLHLCQGRLIIGPSGSLVLQWVAALLVVLVAPSSTVTAQLMIIQRCHQPFRCCHLLIWFFYSGIRAFDKWCGTDALRPLPPSQPLLGSSKPRVLPSIGVRRPC